MSGTALAITRGFYGRMLDLSRRSGAPAPGWDAMPECRAVRVVESCGGRGSEVRRFLTFVSALDRARDADRLWDAAARLYTAQPWAFAPVEVTKRTEDELRVALRSAGVSQRHGPDSDAWHRIARALESRTIAPAIYDAIEAGQGDTDALLQGLQASRDRQPLFPMLRGPKVSRMWVRMLAAPGGATIRGLDSLPVAVDVQVSKVTRYLGILDVKGGCDGPTRQRVQDAWRRDVEAGGAEGPAPLGDTCAALDPAIWFFGKWGCTFCERARQRMPISAVCEGCRLP